MTTPAPSTRHRWLLGAGGAATAFLVARLLSGTPAFTEAPVAAGATAGVRPEPAVVEPEAERVLGPAGDRDPAPTASSRAHAAPPSLDVAPVMAAALLAQMRDPSAQVDLAIARMTDAELISSITRFTNIGRDELARVSDVPDYARRLAGVAMSGVLPEARPPAPAPGSESAVEPVVFARSVDAERTPDDPAAQFVLGPTDRIYAVFPSDAYTGDRVLAKWFRRGDFTLLLFGTFPIHRADSASHVWMERAQGWQPGAYVVELYDPSEPLQKLAAGEFDVTSAPRRF
jgi:hypothetical protein